MLRELCDNDLARCTNRIAVAVARAYDRPRAIFAFEPADPNEAVKAVTVKSASEVFEPAIGRVACLFVSECSLGPVSPDDKTEPAAAYTNTGSRAYIKSQPDILISHDYPNVISP